MNPAERLEWAYEFQQLKEDFLEEETAEENQEELRAEEEPLPKEEGFVAPQS